MKLLLGSESYQGRAIPVNGQRLVNLYSEMNPEGSSYPFSLFGTPGLEAFATLSAGGIQGHKTMGGVLYAVSGGDVYTVTAAGVATMVGSIGANSSRVMMETNGTQMAILKSDGTLWVANSTSVTQVTDGDYTPASSITYMDGYGILSKTSTGQFFITALNDFTSIDALDFATAEEDADSLVRVFAFNSGLWLFGEDTTEVWYNSGNADFPFEPISGAVIERGCAAKHSVAEDDNTIFWLGDDRMVWRADGYSPLRISTHAVEAAIESYTTISDAHGYTYTQEGHKFYVLTFPTENKTWVYDAATQKWHERESWEDGVSLGRWRVNSYCKAYDKHIVGDYANGNLYLLDLDTYTENGQQIRRYVDAPPVWMDNARMRHNAVYVDFLTGQGLTTGQGSDPQAWLQWSDDGGRTFGNEHWRDIGQTGEYGLRAMWRRLGMARKRIYRVGIADPVKVAILGGYLEAEPGAP